MNPETTLLLIEVFRIVFSVAIGVLVFMVVYHLLGFIEERRRMKKRLIRQRDEMVADLFTRVLFDQNNLHNDAMEARKNMIRVSFEMNQQGVDELDNLHDVQDNNDIKPLPRRLKRHL